MTAWMWREQGTFGRPRGKSRGYYKNGYYTNRVKYSPVVDSCKYGDELLDSI